MLCNDDIIINAINCATGEIYSKFKAQNFFINNSCCLGLFFWEFANDPGASYNEAPCVYARGVSSTSSLERKLL